MGPSIDDVFPFLQIVFLALVADSVFGSWPHQIETRRSIPPVKPLPLLDIEVRVLWSLLEALVVSHRRLDLFRYEWRKLQPIQVSNSSYSSPAHGDISHGTRSGSAAPHMCALCPIQPSTLHTLCADPWRPCGFPCRTHGRHPWS